MRWLGRSRRYSPFNRAYGLRRLPDDLFGVSFLASVILHAALLAGFIRLTDALPGRPGGENVSAVLMDLTAGAPAGPPAPVSVPTPAPSREPRAAARLAVTEAKTSPPASGARLGATALPTVPSVEALGPAQEGPTLVSTESGSTDVPDVTAPLAHDIDTPLDAGRPEPSPVTVANPPTAQPAKTLTSVSSIDWVQRAPEPSEPVVPVVDAAPPPPAAPVQARSMFGLNRDRALVRLDGRRAWVSDEPNRTVSGTITGGVPERLVVYVNGAPTEVTIAGRTFETPALLRPGANELRAVVTSPDGLEAEDTITVQYVPRPSSSGIALTSPPDGLTLGPDDPPVAVVEGEVDDKSLTTVWIVANDRRIPVAARAGKFRHTLLLPDPLVHVRAEASGGDAVSRSGTVTVRTTGARRPTGILVVQWPAGTEGSAVEVSATWRAHSERLDTIVQAMRLPAVEEGTNGAPSAMFYLRALKPGVYTLIVRYGGAAPLGDVRPTLYLPDRDQLAPRALGPLSLNGAGRTVVAKVLMPQAVLWSQDDWFSGLSESVDTVTKFRVPEGISWVERKVDLQ